MQWTKRGVIVLAAAMVAAGSAWAADPLVGRWRLASIDGKAPPKFLGGTVRVIQPDGQVVSIDLGQTGARGEANESAILKALESALLRGTWRAAKGRIYVSNSPLKDAGSAYTLSQQGNLLSLEPDPYLSDAGAASKATYERMK